MLKFIANTRIIALAASLALAGAVIIPLVSFGQSDPDRIIGYAWSETVGWISLDCGNAGDCDDVDYGFVLDGSGTVSGYAWSENIGWVSANAADLAACPSALAPRVFDSAMTGWLKVLSGGTQDSGGWDGCISLNGTTGEGGTYGVKVAEDKTFLDCQTDNSCAWGDTNIGWLDFSHARIGKRVQELACTLRAAPSSGQKGTSFNLNYTTKFAVSAKIDGISVPLPNGSVGKTAPGTPATYTYTLTVTDADGNTKQCPTTFKVNKDPPKCEPDPTVTCKNGRNCQENPQCTGDVCWGTCGGTPAIDLWLSKYLVRQGDQTLISWTSENVSGCVVTGNGRSWPGLTGENVPSGPIMSRTEFTLACDDLEASKTVNIVPSFIER